MILLPKKWWQVLSRTAVWLLVTTFVFTGCSDELNNGDNQILQAEQAPTAPNQLATFLPEVSDGMLAFADFDAFNTALDAVAPLNNLALSDDELRAFEYRLGVKTMQGKYLDLVEAYDTVEDLPSNWLQKNRSVILPFDGGIRPTVANVAFRTLINQEGRVLVGKDLYVYTKDFILIGKNQPDPTLIEEALLNARSNLKADIHVIKGWQQSREDAEAKMCTGGSTRGCTANEVDDHRVSGDWGYTSNWSVTYTSPCNFCDPEWATYTIRPTYFANARVEDRGWFNRWTRDRTILSFTCGVRATGLSGSGTGWTSNSRVREINVAWPAGSTTITTVPAGNGQVPAGLFRTLDYVTGGVDDEEIDGLFCFGCCPWTCASLDENDIP